MPARSSSVNLPLLCSSILINLLLIRFAAFFLPDRLYFSFSSFLFDTKDLDKPAAIAIKLSFPFFSAFLVGFVIILAARHLYRRDFADNDAIWAEYANSVGFGAFAAAFVMAWPYILLWDVLVDPLVSQHRLIFLISYFAYFVAAGLFALAGFNLSLALSNRRLEPTKITLRGLLESKFITPIIDALGGTASAVIATLIALQVP